MRTLPAAVLAAVQARTRDATPTRSIRVLGIDTSLRSTGLALVESCGGVMRAIDCRPVKNPAARPLSECLVHLSKTLEDYLAEHQPDEAALEGIFFFRNAKSALLLGHARGTLIATCARVGLPLYEYSPKRIKLAVTGSGGATKEQIQHMMQRTLNLSALPQADAADALAIAITHLHSRSSVAALAPKRL